MTLVNSQPQQCGWELLPFPLTPTSLSKANSAKGTVYTVTISNSNSYTPKQVGLFNTSFLDHRDPPSTGPGARLIPWFLPGQEGHPGQGQSKNTSLRASSLSLKNPSTIYLSCPIEDITGQLGYAHSILYSSFSTTLLLYQAPFPNPPTSLKQTINCHIFSSQLRVTPTLLNIVSLSRLVNKSITEQTIKCYSFSSQLRVTPTLLNIASLSRLVNNSNNEQRTANNSTRLIHIKYTLLHITQVTFGKKIRTVINAKNIRTYYTFSPANNLTKNNKSHVKSTPANTTNKQNVFSPGHQISKTLGEAPKANIEYTVN